MFVEYLPQSLCGIYIQTSGVGKRRSEKEYRKRHVVGGFSISRARCTRKTYALLLEEGFTKEELDAFKPDFILKDRKKFDEADVIIGMGYLQWFLLPFKYKKKYVNLSKAAIGKNINIPDPFYRKSMEFYKNTMDVIKTYLIVYAEKLEKEFSKKD
ncbi:MAG: hypothetical protein L6V79_02505 [Clostridium sp.]|nr:MAG: hypothetical protein L6V79_02505 [Clostridium sp.]